MELWLPILLPGFLFIGMDGHHPAPSDPYIIVNSTNPPSVIPDVSLLPAGNGPSAGRTQNRAPALLTGTSFTLKATLLLKAQ
jgi:hypothetical protein